MADETIQFVIREDGGEQVIELLKQLGLAGDVAAARLNSAFANTSDSAASLAARIDIVTTAQRAGFTNTTLLAVALDKLRTSEQQSAASKQRLAQLSDAITAAMQRQAAATTQMVAGMSLAQAREEALAATEQRLATSFTTRANAADAASRSLGAGTSVMGALAASNAGLTTGLTAGAAASVTYGERLTGIVGAARSATSAMGGLTGAIGAYLSVKAAIGASDEYTNLSNKLRLVTGSTQEFNAEYTALLDIANRSQTDLGDVVNIFARFRSATDPAKVSTQQLNQAVSGLAIGLRLAGATTQETSRVMRDLSEGLATGTLQSQQLNSALRQAPTFMKELGDALGITIEATHRQSAATSDAGDKLALFNEKQQAGAGSVAGYTGQLKTLTDQQNKNSAAFLSGKESTDKYLASQAALTPAIQKANAGLSVQQKVHDDVTAAEKRHLTTQAALQTSYANTALTADQIVQGLIKMGLTTQGLTIDQTSFGSALEVLHNQFVNFFRDGTDANSTMTFLKGVILEVAKNFNTLVPYVLEVTAAFFAMKLVTLAADFVGVALAVGKVIAATSAFLVTPYGAIFGAIGLAIALIAAKTGLWAAAQDELTAAVTKGQDAITAKVNASTAAYNGLTDAANNAANAEKAAASAGTPNLISGAGLDSLPNNIGQLKSNNPNYRSYAGFRDGGSFTVPGGSGVDSVPVSIMVSPGETVAVLTPPMAAGHIPVPHNDNGTHYASGGYFTPGTGFGVSSGTGVSVALTGGSVTGYTPAAGAGAATGTGRLPTGSGAVATDLTNVLGWSGLSGAAQQVAFAAGVGVVKEVFSALYQDMGLGVRQLDGDFLVPLTKLLFDNSGNLIDRSTLAAGDPVLSVILNPSSKTDASGSTATPNIAQATTPGALSSSSAAVMNRQAALNGSLGWSWAQPPPLGYDSYGNAVYPGYFNTFSHGATAVISGSDVTNYSATATPTAATAATTSTAQTQTQFGTIINGNFVPYADTGATLALTHKLRDGGDLIMGGSGVDSRLMQLAVSPGETVHVRTPQQVANSNDGAPRIINIVTNLHAKDADSVRASAAQIAAAQLRMQRRVARRA